MEAGEKGVRLQRRIKAFRLSLAVCFLRPDGCASRPWIWLLCLFVVLSSSVVWSSDFYLPRLGPTPLRFSQTPGTSFAWPVPLLRTNAVAKVPNPSNAAGSAGATNSTVLTSNSPAPLTSGLAGAEPPAGLPLVPGVGSIPVGVDTNSFTASNLLNVTPQMLADYFRATLENTYRFSTNALNGAQIPFNPPLPTTQPAPSSEAIYRVQ